MASISGFSHRLRYEVYFERRDEHMDITVVTRPLSKPDERYPREILVDLSHLQWEKTPWFLREVTWALQQTQTIQLPLRRKDQTLLDYLTTPNGPWEFYPIKNPNDPAVRATLSITAPSDIEATATAVQHYLHANGYFA